MPHDTDPFSSYLTIEEAAKELELAASSIRRMIAEDRLPAKTASPNECAALLTSGRIKGVPGTGVRLIREKDLSDAKLRPKRGRPQHKRT
jgi:hypothetical protein